MTTLQDLNDSDLLRLMSSGDEDAFTALYRRRQAAIFRFAIEMTGSSSMAEEVTQEAFMTLIREAKKYEPSRGAVAAFLYGIARNHVLRCLDREHRYVSLIDDGSGSEPSERTHLRAAPVDLLEGLVDAETAVRVRRAVLALPPKYREVVVLCDLEELDYAVAAHALKCRVGTIRSRLHRARALLLTKLRAVATGEPAAVRLEAVRFP